ncbi:hypothetical protein GCM10009784_08300 [Arthrobacter parietis]|uniref:Major facilitator superfamily (MFS) profile domain-containing protein n=1 Tax=Arthrobacter parietis TaxID=271434 RepID=A0ABP5MKH1_9MICC
MGEQSTPLANACFRMIIFGAAVGAVIAAALYVVESFADGLDIVTLGVHAGFASMIGALNAATVAAPAIGLHRLAEAKKPTLRVPAAALGGALGPLTAAGLLMGGSPFNAPLPALYWILLLPAAALASVYFTQPLRQNTAAHEPA